MSRERGFARDYDPILPNEHHVFCNGDPRSPVIGCRWCDWDGQAFWARFPYTSDEEIDGLVAKYFPNAKPR